MYKTREDERRIFTAKLLSDGFDTDAVVKYTGLRRAGWEDEEGGEEVTYIKNKYGYLRNPF